MLMFKWLIRLVIISLILGLVGISFIPVWTTHMAENAFKHPKAKDTPDRLKEAIELQMGIFLYPQARKIAEKAIIYFPESKHIDFFIYSAALCADREHKYDAAIHWYSRFVDMFPDHPWTPMASNQLKKLIALHGDNT